MADSVRSSGNASRDASILPERRRIGSQDLTADLRGCMDVLLALPMLCLMKSICYDLTSHVSSHLIGSLAAGESGLDCLSGGSGEIQTHASKETSL
jgi:hypothetical protein